jgi:hypothetical protein
MLFHIKFSYLFLLSCYSDPVCVSLGKLLEVVGLDRMVIMAMDEAESLCRLTEYLDKPWSKYVALRRALRLLRDYQFWSLFLATAGKLGQFTPPPHMSMTGRLVQGKSHFAVPFSALGFDHLAAEFLDDGTSM